MNEWRMWLRGKALPIAGVLGACVVVAIMLVGGPDVGDGDVMEVAARETTTTVPTVSRSIDLSVPLPTISIDPPSTTSTTPPTVPPQVVTAPRVVVPPATTVRPPSRPPTTSRPPSPPATTSPPAPVAPTTTTVPPSPTAPGEPTDPEVTASVGIAFLRNTVLVAVPREVNRVAAPFETVALLAEGPTDEEAESGLRTEVPADTTLVGARLEPDGPLVLRLSAEFAEGLTEPTAPGALAQVVCTQVLSSGVETVSIEIDGRTEPDLFGIDIATPTTCDEAQVRVIEAARDEAAGEPPSTATTPTSTTSTPVVTIFGP